jgi:hypothetical protein
VRPVQVVPLVQMLRCSEARERGQPERRGGVSPYSSPACSVQAFTTLASIAGAGNGKACCWAHTVALQPQRLSKQTPLAQASAAAALFHPSPAPLLALCLPM